MVAVVLMDPLVALSLRRVTSDTETSSFWNEREALLTGDIGIGSTVFRFLCPF